MSAKDFADIIRLIRRSPLQNMDEAEYVAELLKRFSAHAQSVIDAANKPEDA